MTRIVSLFSLLAIFLIAHLWGEATHHGLVLAKQNEKSAELTKCNYHQIAQEFIDLSQVYFKKYPQDSLDWYVTQYIQSMECTEVLSIRMWQSVDETKPGLVVKYLTPNWRTSTSKANVGHNNLSVWVRYGKNNIIAYYVKGPSGSFQYEMEFM